MMVDLLQFDFFSKSQPVAQSGHVAATAGRPGARVSQKVATRRREEVAQLWAPGSLGELLE